ncbi:unnamed protein product [Arctogadus glacialis]
MDDRRVKLKDNISLLQIDLRDMILEELQIREQRAVDTIKTNLRYFYSFAKRFAKAKSNAGPLKDSSNTLRHRPQDMANILQEQFYSAFSDPDSPDIEQTMRTPQGSYPVTTHFIKVSHHHQSCLNLFLQNDTGHQSETACINSVA